MENICNCMIEDLMKRSFSCRTFEEKTTIINNGKPAPHLNNLRTQTKSCVRSFSSEKYVSIEWLMGCSYSNTLYCWPCLLFSNEKSVWTSTGFSDLNNLSKAIKRHGKESKCHLTSIIKFKTFGTNRIENKLDTARKISIEQYNSKVKANRNIFRTLINSVCYLGMQELAFRGDDESVNSVNRGNYVELIYLLAEENSTLKIHLDTPRVFTGLPSDIQNDLIISISNVISNSILKEIIETDFVSIILDESTDITNKSQLAVLLRYITNNGCVVERFIEFVDVSMNRNSEGLSNFVLKFLNEKNLTQKLISQSYDGAAVMSGDANGLQAKIREKIPCALFIHCFAHKLNLVLSQSCNKIKECKVFFQIYLGLLAFLTNLPNELLRLTKL